MKKLIELLPVSRKKYLETLLNTNIVLEGLTEADAHHSQIETNLIQQLQILTQKIPQKTAKKNGSDPAFQ